MSVGGSLNQVKTDLAEKLQQAIDNVRASQSVAPSTPGTQTAPGTQVAPAPATPSPKKRSPFGDLLKELGR